MKIFKKFFIFFILFFVQACSFEENRNNQIIFGLILKDSFAMYDQKNNLVGFNIDLGKLIAKKMKKKPVFKIMNFPQLFPSLENDYIDLACQILITEERKKNFIFSDKYLSEKYFFIFRKKDQYFNVKNFDEFLQTKPIIGSIIGSAQNSMLESRYNNRYKKHIFDEYPMMFKAFEVELIDSFVANKNILESFIKNNNIKNFEILPAPKDENFSSSAFMFNKKNNILKENINSVLKELNKNGDINFLKKKYLID